MIGGFLQKLRNDDDDEEEEEKDEDDEGEQGDGAVVDLRTQLICILYFCLSLSLLMNTKGMAGQSANDANDN